MILPAGYQPALQQGSKDFSPYLLYPAIIMYFDKLSFYIINNYCILIVFLAEEKELHRDHGAVNIHKTEKN
jgi:hypothetical protein